MATDTKTIELILGLLVPHLEISAKKMFGEYGIYHAGKMVAMVCDDLFFVKPTLANLEFAGEITLEKPYPHAKPCWLYTEEELREKTEWLAELLRRTADALPTPKKKK